MIPYVATVVMVAIPIGTVAIALLANWRYRKLWYPKGKDKQ